MFNINQIKAALKDGGARQNLFSVQFRNPANQKGDLTAPFLIQATSIPSVDIGTIQVPFFGRFIKLAGDRQYPEWQVSVLNDENFLIRDALEEWSNRINGFTTNVRTLSGYKSEATVTQYSKDGRILRQYEFHGIFPTNIGAIGLNWAETDQIEMFDVTFAYDYWTVAAGVTGNAGGN